MTRAAIYLRFSSDMQRDGWTIDSQRRICRAYCEARGFTVAAEYLDEAQSGASTDRPGFAALLDAARARAVDVIVVHKLDRFSRSIIDVLTTLRELERVGVAFASASEQFDFTTPIGRVMLTMLAAFAEWYLDNLSAETTRGKRERAAQGRTNGRPPLGYRLADGVPVPDERAEAVRDALERYAAGEWTDRDVADSLGVAVDSAAAIIRNPFYAGLVTYRGMKGRGRGRVPRAEAKLIPGVHESLVSRETWEQAQALRLRRKRHGGTSPHRVYLLGKIVRCSECGGPLRAKSLSDRDGQLTYGCTARRRGKPCAASQAPVRESHLVPQIEMLMRALTLPRDIREAIAARPDDSDAELIATRRRELNAERDRLALMFRKGHIDERALDDGMSKIADELATLRARSTTPTPEAEAMTADLWNVYQRASQAERAELLRIVLDSVIVDTSKKSIAAFVPHADFAAMFEALSELGDLVYGSDGRRLSKRGLRAYCLLDDPPRGTRRRAPSTRQLARSTDQSRV